MKRPARLASFSTALLLLLSPEIRAQQSNPPIRLHPDNAHYFLFRGKPTVLIASGEHYGALLNTAVDYRRYLDTLASDGLNYTRLFTGSYVEVPAKSFGILRNDLAPASGNYLAPWARSKEPGYAGGGNKFDLDRWDPAYFTRLHDFLTQASQRGIVVEITFFSSQYNPDQWKVSPFHPANNINHTPDIDWKKLETLENGTILGYQEKYVRKLVRETNQFDNVIFEIQNEPWSDRGATVNVINPYLPSPDRDRYPNSVEIADTLSLAWQARVAEWIAGEEADLPSRHLIAQNYANFLSPVTTLVPHASIVNFHYAYPEASLQNYGLGVAIAYDETGFLGRDDSVYRRQAWNFMLAGGSTFDNLDYSFSPGHEDGLDTAPNGPGGGSASLRKQLRILREFLESLPFVDMHPDFNVVAHAEGAVAHALSQPGQAYGIYLDGAAPGALTLNLPAGSYTAEWINPESGSIAFRETFHHAGGSKAIDPPHLHRGVALRIRRTEEARSPQ